MNKNNLETKTKNLDTGKRVAKSTLALIIFAFVGKVFGFGRISIMAHYFGATADASAFHASFKATSLFSILISSAITTTFIPMLAKVEQAEGPESKNYHANNMLFLTMLPAILISIIGVIFAPWLMKVVAGRFDQSVFDLSIKLTRISMTGLVFSAIVGILTGYLQNEGRFAATGAISIPFNIVYIAYMVILSRKYGIVGMSVASVIAVLAQAVFLAPYARKAGLRIRPVFDIKDKFVIEALVLCAPVLFSVAINDINSIVNTHIASGLDTNVISVMEYANRLNILIHGIFITAITAVAFPILSREFSSGNFKNGKRAMSTSIKFIMMITIPSTFGLIILAQPMVETLFMSGKFTQHDANMTAVMLRIYAIALTAMSLSNILNRVYYSLQDTLTPLYLGILLVTLNIVLNLTLVQFLNYQALAIAVCVAHNVTILASFYVLHKKIGHIGMKGYIRTFIKAVMASTVMGFVTEYGFRILSSIVGPGRKVQLLAIIITIILSVIVYAIMCYILGMKEFRMIVKAIKRRRKIQEAKNA